MVVERALAAAMDLLRQRLGAGRSGWRWGRLHRYAFRHPGATSALTRLLLNPTPRPAAGDQNTVNVSWYYPVNGSFDVTTIPSLRMIVPVGDPDGMRIIIPLGQSGQPGHPHYDDMSPLWVRGDYVPLPMGRAAVEAAAAEKLILRR